MAVAAVLLALPGTFVAESAAQAAVSSEVTVTARAQDGDAGNAPFPDLAVTVSQTKDLINQGILVSWTGASASTAPSAQTGGENFLQIAQCWGDDPDHPGEPDRTTCQYGAMVTPGATRDSTRSSAENVEPEDEQYTIPASGFSRPTFTTIPFLARNGVLISGVKQENGVNVRNPVDVNTNQFFTSLTTNEIPWAGSATDGSGSAKFELQTAAQSPGLGCGNPETQTDGSVKGASCWLVIIPRGTADKGESLITKSGLFWDTWKHRIAVKLDFRPLGLRCSVGAAERQLSGSELVSTAIASWQPALCSASGGSVYSLITGAESDAAAAANGKTVAGLALTSRALSTGATDTLKYAPIALTGVAIAFSIDRFPSAFGGVPQELLDKTRLPFSSLKLTPRLVAKLLTNSYVQSLPEGADRSHIGYVDQAHPGHNPQNITFDPDFLAINDEEWKYQQLSAPSIADLLVPQGRSDTAWAVWSYVLADKDAVDFLAGKPDPWGMVVNPWSATDASVNKSGTALELPRDNFPKADPIEFPASAQAGAVNLVTWRPYTNDLDTGAYLALRGDGQVLGAWDSLAVPPKYTKTGRNLVGFQKVLALTDTGSAARYSVVTASLRNPAGSFVAPSVDSLTAAAAAMSANAAQPQVFGFDPRSTAAKTAPAAYPLAMPVFAAASPAMSDTAVRASYAAFIRYATTAGQVPGDALGQLPAGYAPIPQDWVTKASVAAAAIAAGPVTTTTTTTSTSSSQSSTLGTGTASGSLDTLSEPAPTPTGEPAGALSSGSTSADPDMVLMSSTVPVVLGVAILAGILVPVLPRFRKPL